jgi:hypothetical protein
MACPLPGRPVLTAPLPFGERRRGELFREPDLLGFRQVGEAVGDGAGRAPIPWAMALGVSGMSSSCLQR